MSISLGSQIARRLYSLACDEINLSHDEALKEINAKTVPSSQWEARFVAHLCKAMSGVAKAWGSELRAAKIGVAFNLATIFTHQSPYVKWKSGVTEKRCELADLMLALIDRRSNVQKGAAMLIQAKLSANGKVTLSSKSEQNQFDLFSVRPPFDVDAGAAPKAVDLGRLASDSAMVYGLTGPSAAQLPSSFSWPQHWVTSDDLKSSAGVYEVTGHHVLAYNLVGMLWSGFGWTFDLPPKGGDWRHFASGIARDDWSMLINYLLAQTFSKPLSAALRVSMGRLGRGLEDVVHLARTNPGGQRMFCITHGLADSPIVQYFGGERETDIADWRIVDSNDALSIDGGGDSSDGDPQRISNDAPEGGPISAILFDVSG